jgi:hypothetical protein
VAAIVRGAEGHWPASPAAALPSMSAARWREGIVCVYFSFEDLFD